MNKLCFKFKSIFPVLVVLALLVSPIVGVARAEDETPAVPEAVTTEAAPAETTAVEAADSAPAEPTSEETVTDSAPTEEAVVEAATEVTQTEAAAVEAVTETAPADTVTETTPAEEPAPEAASTETETPAEVLAAVEESGNEVVVLDEAGETVPLATEVAAAIIVQGDPMWCPTGVLPGGSGCTGSFSTFTGASGLLQELQTNSVTYTGDGTIYIAYDYDSTLETGDINLDGNVFTALGTLTLQGGWDFNTNALEADPNGDPDSFFGGLGVAIVNWTGDVTVNNLFIFGGLTSGPGLQVTTTGDISVDSTVVELFDGTGASLVNSSGDGSVSVTSSQFELNTGDGLYVESTGNITLDNVIASQNNNDGADLRAFGPECSPPAECAASGNISVSNSTFEFNGLDDGVDFGSNGLVAQATQDIYATNVTADFNGGDGASYNSGAILSVVIDGGEYSNNGNNGIEVDTNGNITISNVAANQNVNNGADLSSLNASGDNTISISDSVFNQNGQDVTDETDPEFTICIDDFSCNGIYASIEGGNINLFNVTATENTNNGAVLENIFECEDGCTPDEIPVPGSLIVSHSDFTDNGQVSGSKEECGEEIETGIAFNGALACEGLVTFADNNSIVAVNCSTFEGSYNYGAELFFENGGLLSLNGNVFIDNGLGDVAVRADALVGQTEGEAQCAPVVVEASSTDDGDQAGPTALDCNFAPDGATAFETEAQIARLYNLPGPLVISCFPDGSLGFWHLVDGVGVEMSGYAAPGWETAIGADGFIFDQIDLDNFRVVFTLLLNATARGLPELGTDANWYQVQFFGPGGEQLVNAYLPIAR